MKYPREMLKHFFISFGIIVILMVSGARGGGVCSTFVFHLFSSKLL